MQPQTVKPQPMPQPTQIIAIRPRGYAYMKGTAENSTDLRYSETFADGAKMLQIERTVFLCFTEA